MDYFPIVHRRYTHGMDREEKVNLLLLCIKTGEVLSALKQAFGISAAVAATEATASDAHPEPVKTPQTSVTAASADPLGAVGTKLILHLTDLHFTDQGGHYWNNDAECHERLAGLPARDRRGLLGSLRLDLERQGWSPDLVVISGDLFDKAHQSGMELALTFLTELASFLRLPRRRIVLIPGNHDIRRGVPDDQQYSLFAELWNRFYGDEQEPFDASRPPHQQVYQLLFADLGIEIVCFNSCESLAVGQEHGSIGGGQRDFAERKLRKTVTQGLFRIAVLHHHLEVPPAVGSRLRPDYSEIVDAPLVRDWMASQQFRLAMHGHQHVAWEHISLIRGWHLAIVAGGSAGVGEYGRSAWNLPLTYQVARLDQATEGRLFRRQYLPDRLEWADSQQGDASLVFGSNATQPADSLSAKSRSSNTPSLPRELETQLVDFLATEFPTYKAARTLWERAGGRPAQVDIDCADGLELWTSLWRKARNGAIDRAALIATAQEQFSGNDILRTCLARLRSG